MLALRPLIPSIEVTATSRVTVLALLATAHLYFFGTELVEVLRKCALSEASPLSSPRISKSALIPRAATMLRTVNMLRIRLEMREIFLYRRNEKPIHIVNEEEIADLERLKTTEILRCIENTSALYRISRP